MVFVRDPETGELVMMIPNCSLGAAPRENGDILVQFKDIDTGIPIMAAFDPEQFGEVVKKFQKALGTRLIEVDEAEVRQFGRTDRSDRQPTGEDA